jgi:peptidoglycan-associated lipoprotein
LTEFKLFSRLEDETMSSGRGGMWLVAVVVIALVGAGCPKKTPGPGEEGANGGMEEEGMGGGAGMGATGRGSLGRAQAGLSPEAGTGGPLKDINFDFDSYDLNDTARGILQQDADWLNDHPESRVELEGHCDSRGTVEYNLALGAKRAAAAKTYLASLGVAAGRITTISYGEELPLCTENTESCWARNRRAHFVVTNQ